MSFHSPRRQWLAVVIFISVGVMMVMFLKVIVSDTTATQTEEIIILHKKITTTTSTIHPRPDGSKDFILRSNNNNKNKTSFQGFSFYLMGDTPYRDWQEERLKLQMMEMKQYTKQHPERNLIFTVHVGDIQKVARTYCNESAYERVSTILQLGPLPTIIVPGDNDYYDCPDRNGSFQLFLKYFSSFEQAWHKNDYQKLHLKRSHTHPELFVFVMEGILFIGIHLINAPESHEDIELWNARMIRNQQWVAKHIQQAFQKQVIRGVILLGHALRSPRTRPFFLFVAEYFVNITHRNDIPVLYLHGDGHDWDVDTKLSEQLQWKQYRDIQVDQGGLADPIIVDIAPQQQIHGKIKALKEENDMHLVIGNGLIRLDRQRGKYVNPKHVVVVVPPTLPTESLPGGQ